MNKVKERPMLFSTPMVQAILDGRKTMTRRVLKNSICLMYRLADDGINLIYKDEDCIDEFDKNCFWCSPCSYSCLTEFGLHGRGRWANLLSYSLRRLWSEGVRGLVCVEGTQIKQGVLKCFVVPRKQESDKKCTSAYLHGFSRNAVSLFNASTPFGWESKQQHPIKFNMGDSGRKLEGQDNSWAWQLRGESSQCKINERRERPFKVGDTKRDLQSASCCKSAWDEPSINFTLSEYVAGGLVWVRETFSAVVNLGTDKNGDTAKDLFSYNYKDDLTAPIGGYWKPSIHMPRAASRILLEITNVRVERLHHITDTDAIAEGIERLGNEFNCSPWRNYRIGQAGEMSMHGSCPKRSYMTLWESINGAGSWAKNPWVWVISYKVVEIKR